MKNKNTLRLSALAIGVLSVVSVAQATGLQIRENSTKALGRAFTGTTVAKDDATVAITNPAAMVNLDRTTVANNVSVIDLTGEFTGTAIAAPTLASQPAPVNSLAKSVSGGNGGDPGDPTAVPSFAAVMPLHGNLENLWVGFGVSAPYGLKTEWDKDWVGRYNAVTSDVKVIDATLSAAWKTSDQFSVGVGLVLQYADVTLTNALDLGTAVCGGIVQQIGALPVALRPGAIASQLAPMCLTPTAPYGPGKNDGFFSVSGKDSAIGWTAGFQWRPTDKLAIGYNYKSEIAHELKGDIEFTVPANVLALPGMSTRFASGKGGAELATPSTHTFSASYDVTPSARVMGEYQRTDWTTLDNVTIKRDDGTVIGIEDYGWSASNMYSLGGELDLSPALTLRAGIGRDETPTHDANRTPRLPDNDRTLLSIGGTYRMSDKLSFDAAFLRVNLKDSPIHGVSSTGTLLTGEATGGANVIAVGGQYKF